MKHRVQFVLVVLCCLMLSLGSVSGAGVVSSTEATAGTAMRGSGPHRDSQPSFIRDSSSKLSNNLDHSASDGYLTVPNVLGQFTNLQIHGDPMAFHLGVGDDPTLYRHYQGMARVNDSSGKPYIILARSDNKGSSIVDVDNPGELLVVEMGSRLNRDGERLRSNRLEIGKSMGDTVAPSNDLGVNSIHLVTFAFTK